MTRFNFLMFCKCLVLVIIGISTASVSADNLDNLAVSLSRIRGEVEELQNQLDLEKQQHRNKMETLSAQLADLTVEQRRQSLTLEKYQNSLQQIQESVVASSEDGESLKPVLLESIAQLKQHVSIGLPFKTQERSMDLDKLERQILNHQLDPRKAANRLWAMFEDEIRLSKENGIYQQTIELDGEKRLVSVAKIGSVFLYFMSADDRVGYAQRSGEQWAFVEVGDRQSRQQIQQLFDSLKKQIRQGYFKLPNPMKS